MYYDFPTYAACIDWSILNFAGYPYNLDFDFSVLAQFQNFSINNLGDPFIESNYGVHSRQFEVAVLDWFARLWDLQQKMNIGDTSPTAVPKETCMVC
jgi:hypothetical protein